MVDSQKQTAGLKPDQIFEIIIKRRWFIIIPLCVSLTLGLFYTITAKKTYKASTLILIQPQKVPMQYIQSVISSDLNQRLSTISQQILSRSNLEKIINQYGLFQDAKDMYREDKIKSMRTRIEVKISKTRRSDAESFSVSFKGSKPERVMRIANTLASYFMDENLKVRETQAIGTSEFLQSELQKIKLKLEEKEKILSEFRAKYLGGLPDELESNLRTLDRLQQQLSDKQNALRHIEGAISLVNSQISRTKQIQAEFLPENDGIGKNEIGKSEIEQSYDLATNKLEGLLLKYTAKHPEVIKLIKAVEKLKEKLELEAKENKNEKRKKDTTKVDATKPLTKSEDILFNQRLHIRQLKNEINKAESDLSRIKHEMLVYQQRVEDTPKREQELQSLNRDYTNIREIYNSLLDRQLESEIAVNMEKKQKGEQFRILDHARIPEKPISPDVRKLFMLSIAIGLGLGGGIIFLFEYLDTSIKRAEQIEAEFALPILASIPSLEKPGKKTKNRMGILLFSLFTLYAISVFSVFAVINYKGLDKTINFIKMQLNI
ncbi:MAG: protein GumC [Desulfobacula sp.]|nr:protein GumC [Desulfobacula sp.]